MLLSQNRIPQLAVIGDLFYILSNLLRFIKKNKYHDFNQTASWLSRIQQWKQDYPLLIPNNIEKLSPQEIIYQIGNNLPNAYFTTDVGQHQMWAAQFLKTSPRKWITSAGLGTMGYGLPAAIGVKVAHQTKDVVCISGDASFQMNLQELATIAQYKLNIKIVIVNNFWQGMVRQWQETFYQGRYSHSNMKKGSPNFQLLGQAFGIKARATCSSVQQ